MDSNTIGSKEVTKKNKKDKVQAAKKTKLSTDELNGESSHGSVKSVPSGSDDLNLHSDCSLNPQLMNKSFKLDLKTSWSKDGSAFQNAAAEVIKDPFTCVILKDLLSDPVFLEGVQKEIHEMRFMKKNNDLYKFKQTNDLRVATSPLLRNLCNFLYGDFRKWLINITGISLDDTVDMSSSSYSFTDVLLCHDDELEGRRIAYILYLVPPWQEADGGSLDLFSVDDNGQPESVKKSIIPKWNNFAFFEVSPISYHQVAEVLHKTKVRLSINGWFHGPQIKRPQKFLDPPRPLKSPVYISEEELYSWINPAYLDLKTQRQIKRKFCADSEIQLESFLAQDKYAQVSDMLKKLSVIWHWVGPANKRKYQVCHDLPPLVQECIKFMSSEAMFLILSQLTGLRFHRLATKDESDSDDSSEDSNESGDPKVTMETRRWSHGCYTLVHDDDHVGNECALDAMLFCNVAINWQQCQGGFTTYVARDEDDELLTVMPQSNALALVYRDKETLRFTKYVNSLVNEEHQEIPIFQNLSFTYYE